MIYSSGGLFENLKRIKSKSSSYIFPESWIFFPHCKRSETNKFFKDFRETKKQVGAELGQAQLKLGLEVEVWSGSLKLKFEDEDEVKAVVWSWSLRLKFKVEVGVWRLKLKFEVLV